MAFLKAFGRSLRKKSAPEQAAPPPPKQVDGVVDSETKPSVDGESTEDLPKVALQRKLKELGVHAAEDLLEEAQDNEKSWSVWYNKQGLKVEKTKTCLSKSISGRGAFTWTPKFEYDMKFIGDFLWDDKTKPQYDPATEAMIPLMDIDEDAHVVDQVFRGRFGFAGRDFVVVVNRLWVEDEEWERVVFGARSIDEEDLETVLSFLPEDDENRKRYEEYKTKVVRGVAYLAGIIVSRHKPTGQFTVGYVNDADAKTVGVPRWVVDRVKVDQLKIVANIPKLVDQAWQGNAAPAGGVPLEGDYDSDVQEVHTAVEELDS